MSNLLGSAFWMQNQNNQKYFFTDFNLHLDVQ